MKPLEWDSLSDVQRDALRASIPGNQFDLGVFNAGGEEMAYMAWSADSLRELPGWGADEHSRCPVTDNDPRYLVISYSPEWSDWDVAPGMTLVEAKEVVERHRRNSLSQEAWEEEVLKKHKAEGKGPKRQRHVISAEMAQGMVESLLVEDHGFMPAGVTEQHSVRIPTRNAPVFGHGPNPAGGELRTMGGRDRFVRGGLRATVGPITTNFYTLSPAQGRQLRTSKYVTDIVRSFKTRAYQDIKAFLESLPPDHSPVPRSRALVPAGPVIDRPGPRAPAPRLARGEGAYKPFIDREDLPGSRTLRVIRRGKRHRW